MKKFLIALPLLAILVLPGAADQDGIVTPQARLTAMQALLGMAVDPHHEAELRIELPKDIGMLAGATL